MTQHLADKLKLVPTSPGCYQYFDVKGKLLYVGKAKDLKKRVNSYFQKKDHDPKTHVLVSLIADLKWIETPSEMEALILESQLIKKHLPRYNIKIKDDKSFLYIKIDFHEQFPRPEFIRQVVGSSKDTKIKIFGPYTDAGLLKDGMRTLRKIFKWCELTPHQVELHRKKHRPCFDYHIAFCRGVCGGYISEVEYKKDLMQLVTFLEGKKESLVSGLKKDMSRLSKKKDFEGAARVRDKVEGLLHLGKVRDKSVHKVKEQQSVPKVDSDVLQSVIAKINSAFGYAILSSGKFRIELYDMSNIQGAEPVGSMVVWQDGKMDKREYRKFKIKTVKGVNDFAMMKEVLTRRLGHLTGHDKKPWRNPDLIILDGGKPQLSTIWQLFQKEHINIPLVGLAKRDEEVWGIDIKKLQFARADISKDSPEGYFVQNIRDEAHRFAITFHKKLRRERNITSSLDEVLGIGPATRRKLIKEFGSVRGIAGATIPQLEAVVGRSLALRIKEKIVVE
ncbi:MAG: excinuclease ABC subunit UvrC [Patescibacteria group bacterium]